MDIIPPLATPNKRCLYMNGAQKGGPICYLKQQCNTIYYDIKNALTFYHFTKRINFVEIVFPQNQQVNQLAIFFGSIKINSILCSFNYLHIIKWPLQ